MEDVWFTAATPSPWMHPSAMTNHTHPHPHTHSCPTGMQKWARWLCLVSGLLVSWQTNNASEWNSWPTSCFQNKERLLCNYFHSWVFLWCGNLTLKLRWSRCHGFCCCFQYFSRHQVFAPESPFHWSRNLHRKGRILKFELFTPCVLKLQLTRFPPETWWQFHCQFQNMILSWQH